MLFSSLITQIAKPLCKRTLSIQIARMASKKMKMRGAIKWPLLRLTQSKSLMMMGGRRKTSSVRRIKLTRWGPARARRAS